jgi:hypothetical protein
MAYFAKLGTGNIVENVISINNTVITDANGVEQEQLGVDFINNLYGTNDIWKQTSYNNRIRKNYAGIGMTYDAQRDAFIPQKPYNSWVLNEQTCNWESPIVIPELTQEQIDNKNYYTWNEEILNWELING